MRILRVLAPDADGALAQQVRDAVAAFNRGLDIRLRFLSIVIDDREVAVADPETAAETVGAALDAFAPSVVLVQGGDAAALAAATVAARADVIVAHLGAGERDGASADTERAIDRVCGLLLALGEGAVSALETEGLADRTARLGDAADRGNQVIKVLRAERLRRRGDATC